MTDEGPRPAKWRPWVVMGVVICVFALVMVALALMANSDGYGN